MENIRRDNNHYYCVILAGGRGRRLWPVSTDEKPKQFIDFFGTGRTLLQQTYDRYSRLIPKENIYVTTYKDYKALAMEQLPDLPTDNLLVEPIRRGTAPIVAWATHRIKMRDEEGAFIVAPADQLIQNDEAFHSDLQDAFLHVERHQCLLTMGIRPSRPEPGYGYIQMGEACDESIYHVQSFTEKPEREFAEMFMKSGEFLWNTGLFLTTVKCAVEAFSRLLPSVMRSFDEENYDMCFSLWKEEDMWIQRNYTCYPNMSMEHGILEQSENVCVKECRFGWADIGAWHGIFDALAKTTKENVVLNTGVTLDNSHGNIICLPKGHKLVMQGMENFIIAEKDDILLIMPRSDSSNNVLRMLDRDSF